MLSFYAFKIDTDVWVLYIGEYGCRFVHASRRHFVEFFKTTCWSMCCWSSYDVTFQKSTSLRFWIGKLGSSKRIQRESLIQNTFLSWTTKMKVSRNGIIYTFAAKTVALMYSHCWSSPNSFVKKTNVRMLGMHLLHTISRAR